MSLNDLLEARRLPLRAGVAAGLAYWAAVSLTLGNPIYALVSAVVVTDVSSAQTRKLVLQRILGTFIGAGFGCLAAVLLPTNPLTVIGGVGVPMFACGLLRIPAAAKVAGYVSGIILVVFATNPLAHALDRIIETLLGIAAATAVSLVPLLVPPKDK
jgi:uncharacterized membrane protein YgaE (UPF0421/DUF939 family)